MADPRLNSVHLEPPRRALYRLAREELLRARGTHTLAVEDDPHADLVANPHTLIQNAGDQPPAPADLNYWLVDKDYIYPLKVGVNMLGRLADNDVVIQGPHVSRRHCFLVVQIGLPCELHDSGSRNGTYVNGLKVSSSTKLFTGDEIWICRRRFVFRSKADHLG